MPNTVQSPGYPLLSGDTQSTHHPPASGFELFRGPDGYAFADIFVRGHRETYSITSKEFGRWLSLYVLERSGEAPSAAELKRRIELLEAKALQPESPMHEVYIRVAFAGGRINMDLGDTSWSVIEITADGWAVIHSPPIHFNRKPGMLSLPLPQAGGSIEMLRKLFNVRDDDEFVLLIAWLLNALHGGGTHPILLLVGGEGTAKSTLMRILTALIDPSSTPLDGLPRTERELMTLGSRRYLQSFDNVSALSVQQSDALCRLSTGRSARPIILNSITDVVMRPDLADRCLFISCDSIPEERRRSEMELWSEFEKDQPHIFGLLLDALSQGLRMLPNMKADRLPRMADFALWAMACERALWPQGTFAAAYSVNRAEAVEKLIGADPVVSAIRRLAAKRHEWTGTASELDNYLRIITGNLKSQEAWPSDPARLAARLRQLAPSLNKLGIEVSFTRSGHDRIRLITIAAKAANHAPMTGKTASAPAAIVPGQSTTAQGPECKTGSEQVHGPGGMGRADAADGEDGPH